MQLYLAPEVHAVTVDRDLVFLDVAADAYFCVANGAEAVALDAGGGVRTLAASAAGALLEAGLLTLSPPPPTLRAPGPVTRSSRDPVLAGAAPLSSSPLSSSPLSSSRLWSAVLPAMLEAVGDRGRTLGDLLARARAHQTPMLAPTPTLLAAVQGFEALRPWLPLEGECLQRSALLLGVLRRLGLSARWVFGVRTWPFRAHCWLQVEDIVLADEAERVAAYHPILVV